MRVKCKVDITGNVEYSDTYNIDYGTPQGSCLGPLLFLIFCNDINLHLDFMSVIQFADDTTLYLSKKNLNYLQWCIECDVRSIIDWFKANKLTLNLSKTICVVFNPPGCKKISVELEFGNVKLKSSDVTKFLGVWIDSCLNWNEHLKQVMIKLKSRPTKKFQKFPAKTWNETTILCTILQPFELWHFHLGLYDKKRDN